MYSWTIQNPVTITPPNYLWWGKGKINIKPKKTPWININGVPITPDTLQAVKDVTGARYLQIIWKDGKPIKVIEHLVSALFAAGIHSADVDIEWKMGFLPVIGPGIKPVYDDLMSAWVNRNNELPIFSYTWRWPKKIESKRIPWAYIIIELSNTFDVEVSTKHKDLADINEQPLCINDVYWEIQNHINARPIARIQQAVMYYGFKILKNLPWIQLKWINPEVYILPWRNDTWEDIVHMMHAQYQEWRNEHYAHTIFADFLWEAHIFFPGEIQAKITLINTNHISRVELLRELYDSLQLQNIGTPDLQAAE